MSLWWKKNSKKIPIHTDAFQEIMMFFVYECPVQRKDGTKVTPRAFSFEERGIVDDKLRSLLNTLKRSIDHCVDCFVCCKDQNEIINREKELQKKYNNTSHIEFFLYIENCELQKTRTVYYCLRNAIAHGTFTYVSAQDGENYYYFETEKDKIIKSRICLREKTLLKWIKITRKIMK